MPHPTDKEIQEHIDRRRTGRLPKGITPSASGAYLSRQDIQRQDQQFVPTGYGFPTDPYSRQLGRFDPGLYGGFSATDYAFPPAPSFERQVYPLSYETVAPGKSYFDPGVWKGIGEDVFAGARALTDWTPKSIPATLVERISAGTEAVEELDPDAPWWQRPLAAMGGAFKEELRGHEAIQKITEPARGYMATEGYPPIPGSPPGAVNRFIPEGVITNKFVQQRYKIHRDRGMDHLSALAEAYRQAVAHGEIGGF